MRKRETEAQRKQDPDFGAFSDWISLLFWPAQHFRIVLVLLTRT